MIVDYADPAAPWYADGFAFGLHPRAAGRLAAGGRSGGAAAVEQVSAAARRDPAWLGLKKRADSRTIDSERLGQWERAGQTLRTPEVTLGSGKLWYLVRGPGRAYAVVEFARWSHGPLHGQTLLEWKAKSNGEAGWLAMDRPRFE